MDIRTKLIFALVAVSLASMLALGAAVAPRVDGFLEDGMLERLDEQAESRRRALLWILDGWRERTDLIASRTQLRASLDELRRTGSPEAAERIRTILDDAIAASTSTRLIRVHDAAGAPVASTARGPAGARPEADADAPPRPPPRTAYAGVRIDPSGPPVVTFVAPLRWQGEAIGTLVAAFDAGELLELTESYQGLGETGETLVLFEERDGVVRTLHPTRDAEPGSSSVVVPSGPGSLAARALDPDVSPPSEDFTDYRGERVWAATRFLGEPGWGLAVKVDAREQEQAYAAFTSWLRQTALILAAFAILAGFVLGLRIAIPIHGLAEVANRIRSGDMRARASVTSEDEVGQLARTFNEMADELEERMALLREFRKFFDVSIDLMCIAGTDGYFKRTNPAFQRVLGWSEGELLARPYYDFVHPEDLGKTEREVLRLAEGIPTISFENRFQSKDGSYRRLRWTSYPDSGVLYAIAHLIVDDAPA